MTRVMCKTTDLSREDWLLARKKGIGGSDAGAIVGLSKWRSPMQVYLDKTEEKTEDVDSFQMKVGRGLESFVAGLWEEETGKKCQRRNAILQHDEYDFMIANIDRWVVGENAGLEIKTGSSYVQDQWKNGAIPPNYEIQCMHYMAVTGADRWYLACLIGNHKLELRTIERDEEAIGNLIKIEKRFWEEYVLAKVMPPPDGSEASAEAIRELYGESDPEKGIILDDMQDSMKRYRQIEELEKQLKEEKEQIKQDVQVRMEDAEKAWIGNLVVTWKKQAGRKTIDSAKLQQDQPEIYSKYLKEGKPFRRFTVKEYRDNA